LLRPTNLLNVNPDFQFVSLSDNSATSDYHGLQLKFQRRLSRGLQGLASYTFSHSIDIASTDAFANDHNTPGTLANPNLDRGHSSFDIRHSFTAGVTYDLPAPGSRKVVHAALGGWFSPDNRWVAYTSKESGREEVYVVPFEVNRVLNTVPGSEPGRQMADFAQWRRFSQMAKRRKGNLLPRTRQPHDGSRS
jgi:hypothetical protein